MSAINCGERLGLLRPAQFQAALDRFGLGQLRRAEPVPFGLFGQNVFVTSDAGEWVLRGCPHYDWQFPCEQFFARLLHERTSAPVPWPYLLDPADDIFGWSYALMPRMPGLQLADPAVRASLSFADRLAIARALGHTLAALHALQWPFAGGYDLAAGTIAPDPLPHRERVLSSTDAARSRLARDDRAWLEAVIDRDAKALDVPFTPCFVMGDYKDGNLCVERAGQDWRVSGVFDLMESTIGDGEADLVRQFGVYVLQVPATGEEDVRLARQFVHAYWERRPPRPGFAARFRLYLLRDRLVIWDYGRQHETGWLPAGLSFRVWVAPYLAAAEALAE
jgi:aminoglycoside phosphotransferase (APT) family kinase protein